MAKPEEQYRDVIVESYEPAKTAGLRGAVHIRPIEGQGLATTLHVECSKRLSREHPVGTRFLIRAKLTDREGGGEYLYSSHRWPFKIVER